MRERFFGICARGGGGVVLLVFVGAMMAPGCGGNQASTGSGGARGMGGVQAGGGVPASGGTAGAGGVRGSGGMPASGGAQGNGGAGANGGGTGTGGVVGSGGAQVEGGAGGSITSTAAPDAGDAGTALDAPIGGGDDVPDAAVAKADLRQQAPRPDASQDSCGKWAMTEGVCCAQYCSDDDMSESCDNCGGPGSAKCQVVNAKACTSGQWPEVHQVTDNEDWHYSRSTHFGTAPTGACAFGLYGLCTSAVKLADSTLQAKCDVFCKAYPDLCKDPAGITLRGNFTAPQGNYYTQFWSSLPGDLDNYLSCGECFEIERTQNDGTEYTSGAGGYTPPIVMTVADSCPCSANSKWCCGSGRDHCGEVKGVFKYGCQLPPSPPDPPLDHDPLPNESVHFDLDDIAMSRLQTGDPNGAIIDGVIPTRYRRVPCPVVGNVHIWLRSQGNEYYFALTVVNVAGLGAAAQVDAQLPSGDWLSLKRNDSYTPARPQERYGTWATPQGAGPFALPITLRISDGSGRSVVAVDVIKAWSPTDTSLADNWFIDTGVQF